MSVRNLLPTMIAAALVAASPLVAQTQAGPRPGGPGPRGAMANGVVMLDQVVENAETIGLTTEQITALESLREASLERTADAREVLEQTRDDAGDVLVQEVRDARESLMEEGRAVREEIAATLTQEQMEALRDIVAQNRPGRQAFRGGQGGARPRGPGDGSGPRPGPNPPR